MIQMPTKRQSCPIYLHASLEVQEIFTFNTKDLEVMGLGNVMGDIGETYFFSHNSHTF